MFIVRDMRCKYRTGQIVPMWDTPAEYDYLLLCDGSQISAELYPELVKVLGGNILPNLADGKFLEGWIKSGTVFGAGLPNIWGYFGDIVGGSNKQVAGAFGAADNIIGGKYSNITKSFGVWDFNASRSSPLYGASTTVQPYAMTVKYYICYAG